MIRETDNSSCLITVAGNPKLHLFLSFGGRLLLHLCSVIFLVCLPLSLAQANDFASWTDSTSNPLFGGSVDRAYYPCVIKVGSIYHNWYGDGSNTRHASSTNIDFSGVTFPAPVVSGLIATGPYHPRVLYNASGWNIGGTYYAGPFLMYYTDGANWGVNPRVAHSADGDLWTDIGPCANVIAYSPSPVIYNFDVVYEGGTTWKAYADNGSGLIEYYVSTDGLNWTGTAHNILGSLQPWETSFTSPHVIKSGGQYIMFYGSGGSGSNEAMGVAFSTDGHTFSKSSSNPIFSITDGPAWRNNRTYTPFVIPDGAGWTMYYTGRSSVGVYSIGYALPTSLPPTGSITINSGDATTNVPTVVLALFCSDSTGCSQMCISNTSSCSSWESYSSVKSWTLPLGGGIKTVYARFRNSLGNENTTPYSDSILLDTSAPYPISTPGGTNVTVSFPNGIMVTYDNVVSTCTTTLTVKATADHSAPSSYHFINGGYFDILSSCSYSGNITITFPYNHSDIVGQEQNLKLFHWKNNGWENCTISVDTVNNKITGRVTSLSDFGVGALLGASTGANEYMIALIALLAISTGIFIIRKFRMT